MLIKAAVDADAFASKHSTAKAIVRREGCSSSARAVKLGLASQQVRQMLGLAVLMASWPQACGRWPAASGHRPQATGQRIC